MMVMSVVQHPPLCSPVGMVLDSPPWRGCFCLYPLTSLNRFPPPRRNCGASQHRWFLLGDKWGDFLPCSDKLTGARSPNRDLVLPGSISHRMHEVCRILLGATSFHMGEKVYPLPIDISILCMWSLFYNLRI